MELCNSVIIQGWHLVLQTEACVLLRSATAGPVPLPLSPRCLPSSVPRAAFGNSLIVWAGGAPGTDWPKQGRKIFPSVCYSCSSWGTGVDGRLRAFLDAGWLVGMGKGDI